MANKIILKRGADGNVSSLTPNSVGEPIWGTTSNKLYVASGTSAGNFEWVGATILDEDGMGSDSNTKLATQQSIKAYVDAQDANIASDSLTFTNKTFDANGTGNSLSNVDVADFASGVFKDEDGMDSDSATAIASQQSIKAYVDAQVTAQDMDISADSGSNIAIDLDSEVLAVSGGSGISTSISGNAVTIAGDDATTSAKGVASFSSDNFAVSSGAVTIKTGGVENAELANSSVNYGGVSLSLGGSDTTPAFNLVDATGYPGSSITGTIGNSQVATGIDAAKLADGTVSNTEFQYINSLSSNAQTQLSGKLTASNNLSDIGTASTARTNLGQ